MLKKLSFAIALVSQLLPTLAQASSFNCVMDPAQIIQVSPINSSVISRILVDRGDEVEEGEPVAQMDSSVEAATLEILEARAQSTAQIEAQEARVDYVAAQLDRVRRLVAQNAQSAVRLEELEYEYSLAQSQLTQAKNDHTTLLAEVSRARTALDNTIVRAPASGRIVDIPLSPGEHAGQDRYILEIAQLDPLHVAAYLPIDLYPNVTIGMPVTVLPDPPVSGAYEAQISAIDSIFDTASRTFGIRVDLPNSGARLPAGHRCQIELNSPQ